MGRVLQVVGMGAVLVGLMLGLSNPAWIKHELIYLVAGLAVFYVGQVVLPKR